MVLPVQLVMLLLTSSIANGKELLLDKESCAATGFGQPGFVSSRQFFPAGSEWDGVSKVAFQNSDCTWLAANFLDTGSEFVMILVLGLWADKSMHFIPSLAQALAADSNISTLALDFRGRGESCGVEILPGYSSGVADVSAAVGYINSLPNRYCGGIFGHSLAACQILVHASVEGDIPIVIPFDAYDIGKLSGSRAQAGEISLNDINEAFEKDNQLEIKDLQGMNRAIYNRESYQELVQTNLTLLARAIPTDVRVLWINSRDGTSEEELAAAGIRHLPNVIVNDLQFTSHLVQDARPTVLANICKLVNLERSRRGDEELRQVASKQQRTKLHCPVLPAGPALTVPFRFTVGQYNNYDGRGLVNPAATFHPAHGWLIVVLPLPCFRHDCRLQAERTWQKPAFAYAKSSEEGWPNLRSISDATQLQFDEETFAHAIQKLHASVFGGISFTSYRPFMFQGEVYVSYAMSVYDRSLNLTESSTNSHKHRNQTTGLSKIDVDRKRLVSIFAFAQPLLHRSEPICCDKNWGWVVLHDNLYIAYTALPCLSIFQFDSSAQLGARFISASCIHQSAAQHLGIQTGLDMVDVRISGHPVPWQQEGIILLLVHNNWRKQGGSKHWAVLVATGNFSVTAISSKPILSYVDFILHNRAVQNVIAIGSYHYYRSRNSLRVLYGDGDRYAAWADIDMNEVSWVTVLDSMHSRVDEHNSSQLGDRLGSITQNEYHGTQKWR
ncbi:TPA: hypothetical protein ACH3X2_001199 [Trebouxia sp. C0005]